MHRTCSSAIRPEPGYGSVGHFLFPPSCKPRTPPRARPCPCRIANHPTIAVCLSTCSPLPQPFCQHRVNPKKEKKRPRPRDCRTYSHCTAARHGVHAPPHRSAPSPHPMSPPFAPRSQPGRRCQQSARTLSPPHYGSATTRLPATPATR